MTAQPRFTVDEVVPHAAPMILIDEILDYSEDSLTARVVIRESSLFRSPDNSVPSWVGIEYMAQTIAAWAGVQARLAGNAVKTGYLLGARRYEASSPVFQPGEILTVHVTKQYHTDDLGAFDCTISNDRVSATATLNVYQPAGGKQ